MGNDTWIGHCPAHCSHCNPVGASCICPIGNKTANNSKPTPSQAELREQLLELFDEFQSGFIFVGGSGNADSQRDSYKRKAKRTIKALLTSHQNKLLASILAELPTKATIDQDHEYTANTFNKGFNQALSEVRAVIERHKEK